MFIGSNQARRGRDRQRAFGYLAMPGVTAATFRSDGPLSVDFDELRTAGERIGDLWTAASEFSLTTPGGHLPCTGQWWTGPGGCSTASAALPATYMAPPDIEAGTAPVEGTTHGVVVVDADLLFMGIGPLPDPVVLTFDEGRLVERRGSREPPSHRR